jgi:outer membrane protein OmpA-like peptidoglycan-associated protein
MKQMIGSVWILILLSACTTPLPQQKDDSEQHPQIRTEPLSDSELVTRLSGVALSAVEDSRGVTVILNALSFAPAKAALAHEDRKTIRDLARVLNDPLAADRPIAVEGHTDSVGSAASNLELSMRRAQTVAQELIFNQIPTERISVRGYGEAFPIEANTNPDGSDNPAAQAKNRRVEVIIGHSEGVVSERGMQQ